MCWPSCLRPLVTIPEKAAECLARPLLVDRLIQSYYSGDERFHGELKARAHAGLAAGSMRVAGGHYTRNRLASRHKRELPVSSGLNLRIFDERVRELKRSLGGPSGEHSSSARASSLREDSHRFYAVAVMALDDSKLRLASVEWPKVPFDTWWSSTRQQLPMQLAAVNYNYILPPFAPNGNCRDDSWKPTLQLLDPRYWHTAVWTGTEMIVWGGMQGVGTEYNDGSRYNPATDTWTPVASPGRSIGASESCCGLDRKRNGHLGHGDNTGGRYNPVTDTWRPTSTIGAPVGQSSAVVAWTGKECWYGVATSAADTSDSGASYNPTTNTWTAMAQSPLAGRAQHAAVWTGTEFIIWGGYNGFIGQMYGDGARYNLSDQHLEAYKPVTRPECSLRPHRCVDGERDDRLGRYQLPAL